jgi:hypothetical protein
MMEGKIMKADNWIAVFKTGAHTDSNGNTKTWTERDLDTIAHGYDPSFHEAPVVIGHPKDDAPAYAWVESLKRVGKTLFAKLKDIVPEFAEMIDRGLYKKRSVSLYSDGTLRHIGFLGAMPPAVKGLPGYAFSDRAGITIEFTDSSLSEIRKEIEKIQKEDELINRIAELVANELQADKKLSYLDAFDNVVNKNPEISKKLEEVETELIKKRVKQGGLAGLLDALTKNKMGDNKDISFSEAFTEVQIEYLYLAERYAKQIRR